MVGSSGKSYRVTRRRLRDILEKAEIIRENGRTVKLGDWEEFWDIVSTVVVVQQRKDASKAAYSAREPIEWPGYAL